MAKMLAGGGLSRDGGSKMFLGVGVSSNVRAVGLRLIENGWLAFKEYIPNQPFNKLTSIPISSPLTSKVKFT